MAIIVCLLVWIEERDGGSGLSYNAQRRIKGLVLRRTSDIFFRKKLNTIVFMPGSELCL